MSLAKSPSIEFVVDEVADVLLAYEHRSRNMSDSDSEVILNLPLSNVREREPAEMQRTLGRLVLSFLNSRSTKGLNFPRDTEDEKTLDAEHFSAWQRMGNADTPEAAYDLAVNLIGRGMSNNCWTDIEKGEALLNHAVSAGVPAAIQYQSDVWTLIRPRLERKFKRT